MAGFPPPHATVFPQDLLDGKPVPSGTWFLHYNILRPIARAAESDLATHPLLRRFGGFGGWWITKRLFDKDPAPGCLGGWRDPGWEAALRLPDKPLGAVVLVATAATLRSRAHERTVVEHPRFSMGVELYPSAKWAGIYARVDLPGVYRAWNDELKRRGIPATFLDATDFAFRALSEPEALGLGQ